MAFSFRRYAVIDQEDESELTGKSERYALVPLKQLGNVVPAQHRYEFIQDSPAQPSRYEYVHNSPPKSPSRYEYLQQSTPQKYPTQPNSSRPGTNPVATQKLHELLCTPKKTRSGSGSTPQKMVASPPLSPISKDPFQTPPKVCRLPPRSRAQQKLNYAIGSKQLGGLEKRQNTAIVPPMCSSPIQSIYGETTYSQKSESWMNLSLKGGTSGRVLAVAALVMFLCGVATTGLSFYMLSFMGRPYYLDFSRRRWGDCRRLADSNNGREGKRTFLFL
ncbi:hypothetical protein HUJ05_007244 [Dendroctonus ponderosae]|nr:hypothetical protein HUJ05_007244 [Dendroctonus ponderosae]